MVVVILVGCWCGVGWLGGGCHGILGMVRNRFALSRSQAVKKSIEEFRHALLEEEDSSWYQEADLSTYQLTDLITAIRKPRNLEDVPIDYSLLYRLLKLQVRYYALGMDTNEETMREYMHLVVHHKGLYGEVCEVLEEKFNFAPFQFYLNVGLPCHKNLEKIRSYAASLEIEVNATYNMISENLGPRCKGMGPFLLFHHKINGNEVEWGKTLEYWTACLKAYTLQKREALSKADVVRKLSASSLSRVYAFNSELTGMANATHKLDRYLADATRLAAAAARGSFPY